MRFYSVETPGDFPVSELDPDASILFSPTTFAPNYRYPYKSPKRILIDSGAYHHGHRNTRRGRHRTLYEQLNIAAQFPQSDVLLAHCDVFFREGMDHRSAVDETLRNAEWLMQQEVPKDVQRMLVAQGRDPDELYLAVTELKALSPNVIGLGGLGRYLQTNRRMVPILLEAAVEAAGDVPVHTLGLTAPHLQERMKQMGISQCDSASAMWYAVYGSVLYSQPYRRFRLKSQRSSHPEVPQSTTFYRTIERPLPCSCPVCQDDPTALLGTTPAAKLCRFIHNYFHIKLDIEGEGTWQEAYLSAEFQSVITILRSSRPSYAPTEA